MVNAARQQLIEWFGLQVNDWRHLQTYIINEAQPIQTPPFTNAFSLKPKLRDGLFVCGDYRASATIDGALRSGRHAAEEVLKELPK